MLSKITRKSAKSIDGYKTFYALCRLTRNMYFPRYAKFQARLLHKCGSIRRIYNFVVINQCGMIRVFYYSRRGFLNSTCIDKRGY